MKTQIRTIVLFPDEIQIYRGTKCRVYPVPYLDSKRRRIRIIEAIWDSGKVKCVKESNFVPSWDITYEIK